MRTTLTLMAMLAAALLPAACGAYETEKAESAGTAGAVEQHAIAPAADLSEKVRIAAAIATEIESQPDQAEEILARHDITADSFEQLMYEIAADPQLSKAYEAAVEN